MPVRTALLVLSRSRILREALTRRHLFPTAVGRFIAGPDIADALAAVQRLAARGLQATLNHLGEHVESAQAAAAEVEAQRKALERLRSARVVSHLSVKLTQLGLDLDADLCAGHLRQILEEAAALPTFVRVDMEGSAYTDRTLALYRRLRPTFPNVGVVLQAYLHRTPADLGALLPLGVNVRLCKGAYLEPATVAYPRKRASPRTAWTGGPSPPSPRTTRGWWPGCGGWPPSGACPATGSSSRCSTGSAATCRRRWWPPATGSASTSRTGTPGSPTSCAGWPSAPPTSSSCSGACCAANGIGGDGSETPRGEPE
ncbi:MAG: proline dehydrogenase family protein [candidate division NC10 bacterium]|nr:proline dehydrogenase family protein [candidate division NC10 bacterium]